MSREAIKIFNILTPILSRVVIFNKCLRAQTCIFTLIELINKIMAQTYPVQQLMAALRVRDKSDKH